MKARILFLMLPLLLVSSAGLASDGKMPLTTSSSEAREAYLQAMQYMDKVQPEKARPLFEQAVAADPDFIMAYVGLARSQGVIKDTRTIMKKVVEMSTTVKMSDGETVFIQGLVAAINGDGATFVANTKKLGEMYPNDERVQLQLGGYYFGNSQYPEAIETFERGLQANPEFVPIYNLLGYSYRAMKQEKEAAATFKKAIELDPDNPNAYDSYAELLLKMGQYDTSIEAYEHALKIEPLFPSAQIGIAANLMHMGRHEEARMRLRKINDIAPNDGVRSGVCWALAVTYADEGNLDKAMEELNNNYELSAKIHDTSAMSIDLNNMGRVLIEAGKYEDAASKYSEAVAIIEESDVAQRNKEFTRAGNMYNESLIALMEGNTAEAKTIATAFKAEVERLAPPGQFFPRRIHELFGVIALVEHDFDTALAELNQSDTTDVRNMYRIAQVYEGAGMQEEAREWYGHVVTYRGSLNFDYSFVRHKAENKLSVQ